MTEQTPDRCTYAHRADAEADAAEADAEDARLAPPPVTCDICGVEPCKGSTRRKQAGAAVAGFAPTPHRTTPPTCEPREISHDLWTW